MTKIDYQKLAQKRKERLKKERDRKRIAAKKVLRKVLALAVSVLVLTGMGIVGILVQPEFVRYMPESSGMGTRYVPELSGTSHVEATPARTFSGTYAESSGTSSGTYTSTYTDVPELFTNVPEDVVDVPEFTPDVPEVGRKVLVHVKTGISGGYLNVRSGAGVQYPVVFVAAEGMELEFVSCTDGWVEVRLGNIIGFVVNIAVDGSLCKNN